MMTTERKLIAYRLERVYEPEPGGLATAAIMSCMISGEVLSGMGGGGDYLSPGVVEKIRRGVTLVGPRQPRDEQIEEWAKIIYDSWKGQEGWVPWVEGGNSTMQDSARSVARAAS